jgi:imidazoleglycerol-phosphate dehydratase/histidinol-phosphatase
LTNSFVIGDRETDIQLAENLGAKAIFIKNPNFEFLGKSETVRLVTNDWREIYKFLKLPERKVSHRRRTRETDIKVELNLDGKGVAEISTGIHFFDHMLEQIAKHGKIDLKIICKGDLQVDEHHTIEDVAITLGEAFSLALADKSGMERYGFCLPMDDCLAQVAIDFGGRNWIVWKADFKREKIGEMPTEMFFHFFKSFSDKALCNLNIKAEGTNEHHKIEAIFKAFARSIKMAIKRDISSNDLPSTKGVL